MIHLQARLVFSFSLIHIWRFQVCLHHSYCREFSTLEVQVSADKILDRAMNDEGWSEMIAMTMDTDAGGKEQPPPMQHRHTCSREQQLEETSQGQEATTPAELRGANSSSFPPFLLALVMFILPDPDISQEGATTSLQQTLTQVIFFIYSNSASAEFIFHRRTQDWFWFLHQRTKNGFGPSHTTWITSKGRGEPHPGLAI